MKYIPFTIILVLLLALPVNGVSFSAPTVPDAGREFLPGEPATFGEGLWSILKEALAQLSPAFSAASGTCLKLLACTLLVSVLKQIPGSTEVIGEAVGVMAAAMVMLQPSNAMIALGTNTIEEINQYAKLLLPVITAALAAQGSPASSAALYTGTVLFNTFLTGLISRLLIPGIYIFLCLSLVYAVTAQSMAGKLRDFVKWFCSWSLKTCLYIFTGYMGITGVVSGSADAATLKAAKLTISGVVPVVGGILSDASEAVLVGAGVVKNAVGVYGLLAVIALWIGPFLKIGAQYLLLKMTHALCGAFNADRAGKLIQDFSSAMGLLLAATATVCVLFLISIICFMKVTT